MMKCPTCDSTSVETIEFYYDGDNQIDLLLKCSNCLNVSWITIDESELEEENV